jgi:hypothetical protein
MTIEIIRKDVSALKQVISLWRTNSTTLGFFPNGAFKEYADKGQIIGALDESGQCTGYLLYRISGGRAFIVHLCVHESARRRVVARELLARLFELMSEMTSICLWCRRDYAASTIWQELGFIALADKPGRGLKGMELTFWKRDNERSTLFDGKISDETDAKLRVVLDASVFFDLLAGKNASSQESRSLQADWLAPALDLCVTDEMYNEINRRKRKPERERSRSFVRQHQGHYPSSQPVAMQREGDSQSVSTEPNCSGQIRHKTSG